MMENFQRLQEKEIFEIQKRKLKRLIHKIEEENGELTNKVFNNKKTASIQEEKFFIRMKRFEAAEENAKKLKQLLKNEKKIKMRQTTILQKRINNLKTRNFELEKELEKRQLNVDNFIESVKKETENSKKEMMMEVKEKLHLQKIRFANLERKKEKMFELQYTKKLKENVGKYVSIYANDLVSKNIALKRHSVDLTNETNRFFRASENLKSENFQLEKQLHCLKYQNAALLKKNQVLGKELQKSKEKIKRIKIKKIKSRKKETEQLKRTINELKKEKEELLKKNLKFEIRKENGMFEGSEKSIITIIKNEKRTQNLLKEDIRFLLSELCKDIKMKLSLFHAVGNGDVKGKSLKQQFSGLNKQEKKEILKYALLRMQEYVHCQ